jgi:hypothetical protein
LTFASSGHSDIALQRLPGLSVGGRRIAVSRQRPSIHILPKTISTTLPATLSVAVSTTATTPWNYDYSDSKRTSPHMNDANNNNNTNNNDDDDADNREESTATQTRLDEPVLVNEPALPPSPSSATQQSSTFNMPITHYDRHMADVAARVHGTITALAQSNNTDTPDIIRTAIVNIMNLTGATSVNIPSTSDGSSLLHVAAIHGKEVLARVLIEV